MKRTPITPLLLGALVLAGCSGSGSGPATNPKVLYLAPNGDELHLKLSEAEPEPF